MIQTGEQKKEENQSQNMYSHWQEGQSHGHQRNKSSVALSSMEFEYVALLHVVKEQIWILHLLKELRYNIDNQDIIYMDSQSAIALAHNPEHHARTKHIGRHPISVH